MISDRVLFKLSAGSTEEGVSEGLIHPIPTTKLDCRQRTCSLTKRDLWDFDGLLKDKYPDLFRYEETRARSRMKIYDTLAEVDRQVHFCERWPDELDPITIRKPQQKETEPYSTGSRIPSLPSIRIMVANIEILDLRKVRPGGLTRPIDFVGRRFNTSCDMQGCYPRGDSEAKRFFNAVFRLSAKFMTNSFEWYNLETGELVRSDTQSTDWCGPEGIRLGREDPDFYISICFFRKLNTWCGSKAVPKA